MNGAKRRLALMTFLRARAVGRHAMAWVKIHLAPFFWCATRVFPKEEVFSRTPELMARFNYRDLEASVTALAAGLA